MPLQELQTFFLVAFLILLAYIGWQLKRAAYYLKEIMLSILMARAAQQAGDHQVLKIWDQVKHVREDMERYAAWFRWYLDKDTGKPKSELELPVIVPTQAKAFDMRAPSGPKGNLFDLPLAPKTPEPEASLFDDTEGRGYPPVI